MLLLLKLIPGTQLEARAEERQTVRSSRHPTLASNVSHGSRTAGVRAAGTMTEPSLELKGVVLDVHQGLFLLSYLLPSSF